MNSKVLSFVNKMEGWKTAIKSLHWDSKNLSQHKLCDDIADRIADFQDQVSEVEQSISGKLPLNKLKGTEYNITGLKGFVTDVINDTTSFLKSMESEGDKYIGMRSDCESFLSDMQRNLYLVNFTLKEELKRKLAGELNESMPKKIENHDEIDKFMGRRPKTIKARINQIYRIVKKYGIDSRVYSDEHWQAIDDYYKAIASLGCEVEMKPCAHMVNVDSMQSDGGYCDYAEDGMPRSKQYSIKILFDDGMSIEGYIKCMAAGTVSDPFARYDTCIVLWPKNNRVLEGRLMEYTNPNGDLDDPISPYSNSNFDYNGDKGKEIEHSWRRFDNKPIANSSDSFIHGVKRNEVPYETDKTISRRNRENYFTDYENNKGREFMNNWINGKQELPMENIEKVYNLTENELHNLVTEAVINLVNEKKKIKIAKEKEGTFTAAAKKHGKSVQGFASQVLNNKDGYSPAMVKKANFAKNASKWNKK